MKFRPWVLLHPIKFLRWRRAFTAAPISVTVTESTNNRKATS